MAMGLGPRAGPGEVTALIGDGACDPSFYLTRLLVQLQLVVVDEEIHLVNHSSYHHGQSLRCSHVHSPQTMCVSVSRTEG
jgi:hypothetical protein